MKVSVFDRILTLLACLLLLAVGVLFCGAVLNIFSLQLLSSYLVQYWYVTYAAALLILLLVVRLVYAMLRRPPREYLTISTQGGHVAIAMETLKQIITTHVSQRQDIRACQPLVIRTQVGVRLCLKIAFKPETVLPQATAEIQETLAAHIGNIVGITVEETSVLVDNSAAAAQR